MNDFVKQSHFSAYPGFGDKEKALERARQAVEDYNSDAVVKRRVETKLPQIQARFGDADSAIAAIQRLLELPSGITRGDLRSDSFWDPLRKDPRFAKLLAEKEQTGA